MRIIVHWVCFVVALVPGCGSCPAPRAVSAGDMATLNAANCAEPTSSALHPDWEAALRAADTRPHDEQPEPPSTGSAGAAVLASLADVDRAVAELRDRHLLDSETALRFGQIANDCERRAHVAAGYLLHEHPTWLVGKVFVDDGRSDNLYGAGVVPWGYHVAPYVLATDAENRPVVRVLDPALQDHSLTTTEWVAMIATAPDAATVTLRDVRALFPNDTVVAQPTFCEAVGVARRELQSRGDCGERARAGVTVRRIDVVHSRVWLSNADGSRSGWFSYRADLAGALQRAADAGAAITVRYDLIPFHGGNFLRIIAVESQPSWCTGGR